LIGFSNPYSNGESIQKEFLESKGEGVEHLGFFVDNLWEEVAKLI
jgi:4-hydroxyphenylpyruvate dioxygenase-like putative hemolysin